MRIVVLEDGLVYVQLGAYGQTGDTLLCVGNKDDVRGKTETEIAFLVIEALQYGIYKGIEDSCDQTLH